MARIVRGQTLSIKQKEFIEAARAGGVGTFDIILRHIIPNVMGPVVVYVTLTDARRDPGRELPVLPRPRHPGAADQSGAC